MFSAAWLGMAALSCIALVLLCILLDIPSWVVDKWEVRRADAIEKCVRENPQNECAKCLRLEDIYNGPVWNWPAEDRHRFFKTVGIADNLCGEQCKSC